MFSHVERPYHVAIVGSLPSGFFAAASPLKTADASNSASAKSIRGLPCPHSHAA